MPTPTEIGWVAGLLEGEGNFCFNNTPMIQINMIDFDTIHRLRYLVNGDARISMIKRRPGLKQQYKLNICGKLAISWMLTIYKFMSSRRKIQIHSVILRWKLMPRRK